MAKGIGRSSLIFSAMTLISRVLGLLRDMLVARYFESSITDPFFAALRIPNTLRRFFAEGGFANAFVPVFSATKAEDESKLKDLLRYTSGTLLAALLFITLLGVCGASLILAAVANGLTAKPEQFLLAEQMLRIMFPYILLVSLTAMAGGILNTYGRFAIPALTPVLLNLALIAACLWRYYMDDVGGDVGQRGIELAWAVLLGGVLQLALQLPFLWKLGLLVKPKWGWQHSGVRKILRLMLPTLFGSSVGQLSILVNTFLASHLITGSISWLYYTDRLVELPIALIGVALGTVILPKLSALKAVDDERRFAYTLDWALRWGILVGSAASVGLTVLSPAILATLFYGGEFSANDLVMTNLSLRAYGIAAVFLILVKVLAPAFYARHDTRTPVQAGIAAMAANLLAAIILSRFYGHVGLAAASAVSAVVNVALLFYFLWRNGIGIKAASVALLVKLLAANIAMGLVLHYLHGDISQWLAWGRMERLFHLLVLIAVGMMIYLIALYALGLRKQHFSLGE